MSDESNVPIPPPRRTAISTRLRFEVFKRDRFACQYCGAKAPEAVLHIDHINPVAEGGQTILLNLVTSCRPCNLGKGRRPLSDQQVMDKTRLQLEELETRREQLDMLFQWHDSLQQLDEDTVTRVAEYWQSLAPGFTLNENGMSAVRRFLKRFSVDEVLVAMRTSAETYLRFRRDGSTTQESWELGFNKVAGICRTTRASVDDPDLKELLYIRGILNNRIERYFNPGRAMQWLRAARSWGVPMTRLDGLARSVRNWSQFNDGIDELIAEYRDPEADDDDAGQSEDQGN
jgi:hypothetical protein